MQIIRNIKKLTIQYSYNLKQIYNYIQDKFIMKNIQFFYLLSCLLMYACAGDTTYSRNYETTINVKDAYGQAIKGQSVTFNKRDKTTSKISSAQTNTSDVSGKVEFSYTLLDDEYAQFEVADGVLYKAIHDIKHSFNGKSQSKIYNENFELRMDSLSSMSVRFQKTTNTPYQLELSAGVSASGGGWDGISDIKRDFANFIRPNTTLFDSTVVIRVYSNIPCNILSILRDGANPAGQSQSFSVKASDYKTKPLEIIFK